MQGKEGDNKKQSPHRRSPPREVVSTNKSLGLNPEDWKNATPRTIELATDQSIAARNLLYHPNKSVLAVIEHCADGIGSVMERMAHTGDTAADLKKDEILISMCTRMMADGGTGRIIGFNARLAKLVEKPRPDNYNQLVGELAADCRENMANITNNAKKPGPEGALGRQGILSFMGDLGGIEPKETGFGPAYKGPLCDPPLIYNTYAEGLFDAQRKLAGQKEPATNEEMERFKAAFHQSRMDTSMKGGGLSAPYHTAGKKVERTAENFNVQERKGLLNTGDLAETKLKTAIDGHETTLVNAAWPPFLVSTALIQNVAEPVTGHVSGTFGEMVTTMNMFCGTPPNTVSMQKPSGIPIDSATKDQVTAIASLGAAGLITAGFHSAVEVFQPMSTFTTQATGGSLGPRAVIMMNGQASALEAYAKHLDTLKPGQERPKEWVHEWDAMVGVPPEGKIEKFRYELDPLELKLDQQALLAKKESIEDAATKSVDMISMLQGEGGTIATLEVARVLANQSTDPTVPFKLYSLNTRLDELGLRGHTPELEKARALAQEKPGSDWQANLEIAIKAAEVAADNREILHKKAAEAAEKVVSAQAKLDGAILVNNLVQDRLKQVTSETDALTKIGWGVGVSQAESTAAMKQLGPLEEDRKKAYRDAIASKGAVTIAQAEFEAANQEAIAAKAEATYIDRKLVKAAMAEATAARAEANASIQEVNAMWSEALADEAEVTANEAEQRVTEAQQELDQATRAVNEAMKIGWGEKDSPEALKARQNIDSLEETRKQAFREVGTAKKEAIGPREEATKARASATSDAEMATKARQVATQARVEAENTSQKATMMMEKSKSIKEKMQGIKESEKTESLDVKSGPALK